MSTNEAAERLRDLIDLLHEEVRSPYSSEVDQMYRDLDAALAHERSAGAAPIPEDDMCPNCVTPWKCNGEHMTASCKHDWAINNHWDGGTAPYPIIQCIRCNETSAGAASLENALDALRLMTAERDTLAEDYEALAILDAGAAHVDTDVLEWLDILWRHLDDRWQVALRSGHQKVLARLFERSAGAAPHLWVGDHGVATGGNVPPPPERSAGAAPDWDKLRRDGVAVPFDEEDLFPDPCLYCGVDDDETPYEDTEEHRNTSQHQWAVYDS